jgi:hypothetical protein
MKFVSLVALVQAFDTDAPLAEMKRRLEDEREGGDPVSDHGRKLAKRAEVAKKFERDTEKSEHAGGNLISDQGRKLAQGASTASRAAKASKGKKRCGEKNVITKPPQVRRLDEDEREGGDVIADHGDNIAHSMRTSSSRRSRRKLDENEREGGDLVSDHGRKLRGASQQAASYGEPQVTERDTERPAERVKKSKSVAQQKTQDPSGRKLEEDEREGGDAIADHGRKLDEDEREGGDVIADHGRKLDEDEREGGDLVSDHGRKLAQIHDDEGGDLIADHDEKRRLHAIYI